MKIEINVDMNDRADVLTAYDVLWHVQHTLAKHVPVENRHKGNPAHNTRLDENPPMPSRVAANYDAR